MMKDELVTKFFTDNRIGIDYLFGCVNIGDSQAAAKNLGHFLRSESFLVFKSEIEIARLCKQVPGGVERYGEAMKNHICKTGLDFLRKEKEKKRKFVCNS